MISTVSLAVAVINPVSPNHVLPRPLSSSLNLRSSSLPTKLRCALAFSDP